MTLESKSLVMKERALQALTGLKRAIGDLLPDGSGEEAHRARILMVAGLVFAVAGTFFSVAQVVLWVHPAFPPVPCEQKEPYRIGAILFRESLSRHW